MVHFDNKHASLRIESFTWNRDSHELFDYESRHVFGRQFLLRKPARLFRNTLDVSVVADGQQLPNNADYLVSIKLRDGESRYFVYPADRNGCPPSSNIQARKLWLIVKNLKDGVYSLAENDVIKLGRFKLRVKQIVTETDPSCPVDYKLDDIEVPPSDLTIEESQNMQCRICLLEGGLEDDPLVRACQCKGSIMYIHLTCLQHWTRLNCKAGWKNYYYPMQQDEYHPCCFVRQLQCELCKSPFPSSVLYRGARLNVVKLPNVQPPFIVLENLVGPTNRGVHLCSMAVMKECKLGRGHESDLRIADVSISRLHAVIRYQDGAFCLQDHSSKFGTLVALRKATMVDQDELDVQVGRTVLKFGLTAGLDGQALDDDVVEVEVFDHTTSDPSKEGSGGVHAAATENSMVADGSSVGMEPTNVSENPTGPQAATWQSTIGGRAGFFDLLHEILSGNHNVQPQTRVQNFPATHNRIERPITILPAERPAALSPCGIGERTTNPGDRATVIGTGGEQTVTLTNNSAGERTPFGALAGERMTWERPLFQVACGVITDRTTASGGGVAVDHSTSGGVHVDRTTQQDPSRTESGLESSWLGFSVRPRSFNEIDSNSGGAMVSGVEPPRLANSGIVPPYVSPTRLRVETLENPLNTISSAGHISPFVLYEMAAAGSCPPNGGCCFPDEPERTMGPQACYNATGSCARQRVPENTCLLLPSSNVPNNNNNHPFANTTPATFSNGMPPEN